MRRTHRREGRRAQTGGRAQGWRECPCDAPVDVDALKLDLRAQLAQSGLPPRRAICSRRHTICTPRAVGAAPALANAVRVARVTNSPCQERLTTRVHTQTAEGAPGHLPMRTDNVRYARYSEERISS